jgi:hypothetical protein
MLGSTMIATAERRRTARVPRATWLRDMPDDLVTRWEFVLAMAAMLTVGTGALIATLMGSATSATSGVVRVTYVGVIVLAVLACISLLVIEAGTEGVGPLKGAVDEVDRDSLRVASLVLAATMVIVARISPAVGGLVVAGAAGWLAGQAAYVFRAHDSRWLSTMAVRVTIVVVGIAVLAYLRSAVTGSAACPECTRGLWAMVAPAVGLVAGAATGWVARRVMTSTEAHKAVGVGAVLFVMASTFALVHHPVRATFTVLAIVGLSLAWVVPARVIARSRDLVIWVGCLMLVATFVLVKDPVRATFTVLAIVGLSLAWVVPTHVIARSRDLVIWVGCLVLAGLEILVDPAATVPVGAVVLLVWAATRVPSRWPRAAVALLVGTVGIALSVNVVPPWDELHHAFFLFPMRDVAAGKSLLVDVNAQYGVGVIYALALLTGPSVEAITPTALSAWTNVANVMVYVALSVGCAWVVRDWVIGSVSWLAVVVNRSVTNGFLETFPSTGAWRFGLPWLLIADATFREGRMAPWRRALRVAYWAVATTWSLEVALYSATLTTFDLALELGGAVRAGTTTRAWRTVGTRVIEVAAGAGMGVALLVATTWWRAGQWPDVRHYFEFFGTYEAGLGFHQPELWSAWSPMFLGCATVMVVLALRVVLVGPYGARVGRDHALVLVAAYGVLQFTYYVFRSHSNNLLHVMFPPTVIAIWLLAQVSHWFRVGAANEAERSARALVGATVVVGVALVGASGLTALVPRVPTTLFGQAARLWSEGTLFAGPWFGETTPSELDGERESLRLLLARRFPEATRIPILVADDLWVHAIIGTRVVNAFPLSFAPQDALVAIGRTSAIAAARTLPPGTAIVIENQWTHLEGVRHEMITELCERGALVPVEVGARVSVVRLDLLPDAQAPDACASREVRRD